MDGPDYLRFVLALAFVLALMGLFAQLAKRMGWGRGFSANAQSRRRLNVLEVRPIDARHKLALVSCDGQEHLIVLGPQGQTVVDHIRTQGNQP